MEHKINETGNRLDIKISCTEVREIAKKHNYDFERHSLEYSYLLKNNRYTNFKDTLQSISHPAPHEIVSKCFEIYKGFSEDPYATFHLICWKSKDAVYIQLYKLQEVTE
jgi:hypothetical protein